MRGGHIEWIGDQLFGKDVNFPNNTTWRLKEVLAEKSDCYDEGPAEASAVFSCVQMKGSNIGEQAIVRARMQYGVTHSQSYATTKHRYLEYRAHKPHYIRIQNIGPRKRQKSLHSMRSWKKQH